jgi:hypothetical protein
MATANELWDYAREATQWAAQSKSEQEREACIDLAQTWAKAAIEAEVVSSSSPA